MADDSEVIEIDITEWKKMKVAELRHNVGELGLETKGTKAELIARVEKYLSEQDVDLLEEDELEDEEVEEEEDEIEEPIEEDTQEEEEVKNVNGDNTKVDKTVDETVKQKPSNDQSSITKGDSIPVVSTAATGGQLPNQLSTVEKLKKRGERFGTTDNVTAKKLARAERFGIALSDYQGLGKRPGGALSTEDVEKLKKRAERFGSAGGSPIINKIQNDEKKNKRVERFGLSTTDLSLDDRKQKRSQRFGTS